MYAYLHVYNYIYIYNLSLSTSRKNILKSPNATDTNGKGSLIGRSSGCYVTHRKPATSAFVHVNINGSVPASACPCDVHVYITDSLSRERAS